MKRWLAIPCAVLALAACGGGGTESVGEFDFDDEVVPYAEGIAASALAGDWVQVEAEFFPNYERVFLALAANGFTAVEVELIGSTEVGPVLDSVVQELELPTGTVHDSAIVIFDTVNPDQPNQGIAVTVGVFEDELALFGVGTAYPTS